VLLSRWSGYPADELPVSCREGKCLDAKVSGHQCRNGIQRKNLSKSILFHMLSLWGPHGWDMGKELLLSRAYNSFFFSFLFFFSFFSELGTEPRGLALARQALYLWVKSPTPPTILVAMSDTRFPPHTAEDRVYCVGLGHKSARLCPSSSTIPKKPVWQALGSYWRQVQRCQINLPWSDSCDMA